MKVIFLDVDGVLSCASRWPSLELCEGGGRICPIATKRLKRLVDATDARIVVSSTWRITSMQPLTRWLDTHGIEAARIIGRTPHQPRVKLRPTTDGTKVVEPVLRGTEIQQWLDQHPEVTAFVILDDDDDMVHLSERLVKTTWEKGLLDEHIDRAIALLTGGGDDGGIRSQRAQSRARRRR